MTSRVTRWNMPGHAVADRSALAERVDRVGWSLFFVWMGIAFLADVGWGVGLLGVGVITLGVQAVRKHYALKLHGFSIVVGCLCALGGVSELFEVPIDLAPILCVLLGITLLVSTLAGRSGGQQGNTGNRQGHRA
jgi:hypothetical protein